MPRTPAENLADFWSPIAARNLADFGGTIEPKNPPQKLPRFVLSLTWDLRNLAQNPWRSSRDDIALYPGTFRESIWACSCVVFALQLGSFESAKWLPRRLSATIPPVLAIGLWPLLRAKTAYFQEILCVGHFPNWKCPSYPLNIVHLEAFLESRKL